MNFLKHLALLLFIGLLSSPLLASTGILVVAHGSPQGEGGHQLKGMNCKGSQSNIWEKRVSDTFKAVSARPDIVKSLIFTMWNTACFNMGIADLQRQLGILGQTLTELKVIPLFVSSHNTVVDAQKFILGLTKLRPKYVPPHISLARAAFTGRVTYTRSLDDHQILASILKSRAESLLAKFSIDAENAELFLVFHGPVSEVYHQRLMASAWKLASTMGTLNFKRITPIVLRDDATRVGEREIWLRAKEDFRTAIKNADLYNHKALVLPVVISLGGIEKGIHERLEGLSYLWQNKALLPDGRLALYLNLKIHSLLL